LDVVDALKRIAERLQLSLPQLALAWSCTKKASPQRSPARARPLTSAKNAAAPGVTLSPLDLAEIGDVLEGRGEVVET
jgi:aryl-alcohol dehydrogenase-like predicted oxidoreductase